MPCTASILISSHAATNKLSSCTLKFLVLFLLPFMITVASTSTIAGCLKRCSSGGLANWVPSHSKSLLLLTSFLFKRFVQLSIFLATLQTHHALLKLVSRAAITSCIHLTVKFFLACFNQIGASPVVSRRPVA